MSNDGSSTIPMNKASNESERVVKTPTEARQGTSRPGVIYVLIASLLLAVVAGAVVFGGFSFSQ
jgi:hypothetical protein